jgi:hypothetical protein
VILRKKGFLLLGLIFGGFLASLGFLLLGNTEYKSQPVFGSLSSSFNILIIIQTPYLLVSGMIRLSYTIFFPLIALLILINVHLD